MGTACFRFGLFLLVLFGGSTPLFSFKMEFPNGSYVNERQRVRAPELKGDIGWLNTDKPLSLKGLSGKIAPLRFLDVRLHQLHSHHSCRNVFQHIELRTAVDWRNNATGIN